jgi:hypothetical protein
LPFYRSPVTRWALFTTGLGLAVAFAPWGPTAWRDTPSLHWLHQLLPWPIISLLFALYALLLLWGRTEAVAAADWLGLFIYGCELVALLATIRFDRPRTPSPYRGCFSPASCTSPPPGWRRSRCSRSGSGELGQMTVLATVVATLVAVVTLIIAIRNQAQKAAADEAAGEAVHLQPRRGRRQDVA